MKTHWLLGVVVLIAALLACKNPFQEEPRYTATTIHSVAVKHPSGSGSFTLEVNYETFWIPDKRIPNIYCSYVMPNGTTVQIGMIDMLWHIGAREIVTATKTLVFNVTQKNGVSQPGTYLVGCTTEINNTPVTTTFTVVGVATPTPMLPSEEPTATATTDSQPQTALSKGQIIFDYANIQSSRSGAGGDVSRIINLCIPDVVINTDGHLNGVCEKLHITALLVDESITAQVSGIEDPAGNVTFTYDVPEIGTPNGTWRVSYTGQGKFTSATQAAGTATFSYSC